MVAGLGMTGSEVEDFLPLDNCQIQLSLAFVDLGDALSQVGMVRLDVETAQVVGQGFVEFPGVKVALGLSKVGTEGLVPLCTLRR